VADQDLKRNTQQIWQSLCVLALLTKHNKTAIFPTSLRPRRIGAFRKPIIGKKEDY
jgi:hypothetical protein